MTVMNHSKLITDWRAQVALGQYPAMVPFDTFGRNPAVGTTKEDLWGVGGLHTDLTTGTTLNLTSEDLGDDMTYQVTGLDANWNLQVVNVTCTARTPVRVGEALNWTSVFTVKPVGAQPQDTGDIYIAVDGAAYTLGVPDDPADVQAYVDNTTPIAISLQSWGVVPAGYKALIFGMTGEMQTPSGTERTAKVRLEVAELAMGATVDDPVWAPYYHKHSLSLLSNDSPHENAIFDFPVVCPELTRVSIRCTATVSSEIVGRISALILPQDQ